MDAEAKRMATGKPDPDFSKTGRRCLHRAGLLESDIKEAIECPHRKEKVDKSGWLILAALRRDLTVGVHYRLLRDNRKQVLRIWTE